MASRLKSILRHGQLVFEFINKAKNGVLGQVATNVATAELMAMEPNLVQKLPSLTDFSELQTHPNLHSPV